MDNVFDHWRKVYAEEYLPEHDDEVYWRTLIAEGEVKRFAPLGVASETYVTDPN